MRSTGRRRSLGHGQTDCWYLILWTTRPPIPSKFDVGGVEAFPADLTKPEVVSKVTMKIVSRHGTIDILVNNAGGVDRMMTKTRRTLLPSFIITLMVSMASQEVIILQLRGRCRGWETNFRLGSHTGVESQ